MTLKQWILNKNAYYPKPSFEVWTLNEFNLEAYVYVQIQEIEKSTLFLLDYDIEDLIIEEKYFKDYEDDGEDDDGRPIRHIVTYIFYKITPKVKPLKAYREVK